MAQPKITNKIISSTVETMDKIAIDINSLIGEFGPIDKLNTIDSYLLGAIRAVQASCNYLANFAKDLDKQSRPPTKPKPLDLQSD